MSSTHEYVLYIQEIFFTTLFVLDIMIKLVALGVPAYFSKRWNQVLESKYAHATNSLVPVSV